MFCSCPRLRTPFARYPDGASMQPSEPSVCPNDEDLTAFVEGTLSGIDAEQLEDHLDVCATCYQVIASCARAEPARRGARHADANEASNSATNEVARLQQARAIAPGTKVGRYSVLGWIGEGGLGVVYAAYDPELDRKVALKLMRASPEPTAEDRVEPRLRREARAMARLEHPNVVTVHDLGDFEERLFIAMQFIDGMTLRTWLRGDSPDARPTPREILHMFVETGRGLSAAHAVGVVHRDFKPENVLISKDGVPRVSDFGLARFESQASDETGYLQGSKPSERNGSSTGTAGTPAYMAPEQKSGRVTDARSDQFSFCVALYEALFGMHPSLAGEVRTAVLREVPARVRAAMQRGLSVDPGLRFPSILALLDELAPAPRERKGFVWVAVTAVTLSLCSAVYAYEQPREASHRHDVPWCKPKTRWRMGRRTKGDHFARVSRHGQAVCGGRMGGNAPCARRFGARLDRDPHRGLRGDPRTAGAIPKPCSTSGCDAWTAASSRCVNGRMSWPTRTDLRSSGPCRLPRSSRLRRGVALSG